MWPFYTNFSHKTNNRKGNIILSFKTLGIKLCLGWSSFVIIKRFGGLSKKSPDCKYDGSADFIKQTRQSILGSVCYMNYEPESQY